MFSEWKRRKCLEEKLDVPNAVTGFQDKLQSQNNIYS